MASITERNGRYYVRVRRHGFAPVAKTFTRRADGAAWGRRVEADMEAGRWADSSKRPPTLADAISEYETTVVPKQKGAAAARYRLRELRAAPFARKLVNEVTPFDIARWRDAQAARLKPATMARKLGLLSSVLTWCVKERGWTAENPVARVSKPRIGNGRDRTLTEPEVEHLMAAARTSKAAWLAPALTVLIHSAMRRSELFAMTLDDLDLAGGTAHLGDTKNGSARDVPLCPRSAAALAQLAVDARAASRVTLLPLVSVGSVSTRFIGTVRRARDAYERACAASGTAVSPDFLADVRLHDLRHHAVTAWASTGALSLPELMAISGHKTPRMLTRYTHLSARVIAAKLAGLSAPAAPPPVPAPAHPASEVQA